MERKKGITLPINMIVILIVAVLVVATLVVYFSGVVGVSMSEAEARKLFNDGCLKYCSADTDGNYINAYRLVYDPDEQDRKFFNACDRLGYGTRAGQPGRASDFPNRCLEFCGKNFCDMEVNLPEVSGTDEQLLAMLGGQ